MSRNDSSIHSNEKSSHWILAIFGLIFFIMSAPVLTVIPEEIQKGDYSILIALLFPIVGLGMIFSSWKMRQKFLYFGHTPLTLSPPTGQIGGQVGGRIDIAKPWEERVLTISLTCVHTYKRGSGKNATTHTKILWQEHDIPVDKPSLENNNHSHLEFCFDVPADKPTQKNHSGPGTISWRLSVEGIIGGTQFSRSWKVPVEEGTKSSHIVIPDAHKETSHRAKLKQAEVSINKQIVTIDTSTGLDIVSEQGRHLSMSLFMVIFGSIFTAAGCLLFYKAYQGESMLWIMAPIFFSIGSSIFLFGIFLLGRKLECKIINDTAYTRRSVFGQILYTREIKLTSPEQIIIKTTMTSTSGQKRTEFTAIYAHQNAHVSANTTRQKKIKLVEGIEGKAAGEAMKRKIIDNIFEHNDQLKGELEAL